MVEAPSRFWRTNRQRLRLEGEVCQSTKCQDKKIFPPRDICPDCGQEAKTPYQFSGKGEIYSFAPVKEPPSGFEFQAPYNVALVKLKEGPMVTAQLTDFGDQKPVIGMGVEMVTRKLNQDGDRGLLNYGYKFRPSIIKK